MHAESVASFRASLFSPTPTPAGGRHQHQQPHQHTQQRLRVGGVNQSALQASTLASSPSSSSPQHRSSAAGAGRHAAAGFAQSPLQHGHGASSLSSSFFQGVSVSPVAAAKKAPNSSRDDGSGDGDGDGDSSTNGVSLVHSSSGLRRKKSRTSFILDEDEQQLRGRGGSSSGRTDRHATRHRRAAHGFARSRSMQTDGRGRVIGAYGDSDDDDDDDNGQNDNGTLRLFDSDDDELEFALAGEAFSSPLRAAHNDDGDRRHYGSEEDDDDDDPQTVLYMRAQRSGGAKQQFEHSVQEHQLALSSGYTEGDMEEDPLGLSASRWSGPRALGRPLGRSISVGGRGGASSMVASFSPEKMRRSNDEGRFQGRRSLSGATSAIRSVHTPSGRRRGAGAESFSVVLSPGFATLVEEARSSATPSGQGPSPATRAAAAADDGDGHQSDLFRVDAAADELACVSLGDAFRADAAATGHRNGGKKVSGEHSSRVGAAGRDATAVLEELAHVRTSAAAQLRKTQRATEAQFAQEQSKMRRQRAALGQASEEVTELIEREVEDEREFRETLLNNFLRKEEAARREEARKRAAAAEAERKRILAEKQRQEAARAAALEKQRLAKEAADKKAADAKAAKDATAQQPRGAPAQQPGNPAAGAANPAAGAANPAAGAVAQGSAQDHPDCPNGIRKVSIASEKRRLALVAEIERQTRTMESLEIWPRLRREMFKRINLAVTQITGSREQILAKATALIKILEDAKAVAVNPGSGAKLAAFPWWCGDLVAKKFIEVAERTVWGQKVSLYAPAAVATVLCTKFRARGQGAMIPLTVDEFDFGEILMGHLHRACPLTVPHFVGKRGRSDEEWRAELGFKKSEESKSYYERQTALIGFFAAVMQTPLPKSLAHPLGGSGALWVWLARLLNMKPRFITGHMLVMVLFIAGERLATEYGMQFAKIVDLISAEAYKRKLVDAGVEEPTIKRVETFVEQFDKNKFETQPPFDLAALFGSQG